MKKRLRKKMFEKIMKHADKVNGHRVDRSRLVLFTSQLKEETHRKYKEVQP